MSDKKITNKIENDMSYDQIVKDILIDSDFNKLGLIRHHHTTNRLTHSLKVSYYAYSIAKKLHFDYVAAARSGLLHDFYYEIPSEQPTKKEQRKLIIREHTIKAVENAKSKFSVSQIEEDAIRCHMFPLDYKMPKYRESWIVMIADKLASAGDFSYRVEYAVILCFVFVMNWLTN